MDRKVGVKPQDTHEFRYLHIQKHRRHIVPECPKHAHTYMHTFHTYIHTYMPYYLPAYLPTYSPTDPPSPARVHTCRHTCIQAMCQNTFDVPRPESDIGDTDKETSQGQETWGQGRGQSEANAHCGRCAKDADDTQRNLTISQYG